MVIIILQYNSAAKEELLESSVLLPVALCYGSPRKLRRQPPPFSLHLGKCGILETRP